MITAGGKNITPSEIENALRFSPYIKEAIVIADRRRFVSALIQIDFEKRRASGPRSRASTYTNFRSLAELAPVRELDPARGRRGQRAMPQVQQVRKFELLTEGARPRRRRGDGDDEGAAQEHRREVRDR
jgi:long-chain acyl-CoA synthetase